MVTVIVRKIEPGRDYGVVCNEFRANRMVEVYTKMGLEVIVFYGGKN